MQLIKLSYDEVVKTNDIKTKYETIIIIVIINVDKSGTFDAG